MQAEIAQTESQKKVVCTPYLVKAAGASLGPRKRRFEGIGTGE
jgi:hypothetical protein